MAHDWKNKLLQFYVNRGALAIGEFNLAGGGTSDFYIDGRLITTYPPALRAIVTGMSSLIKGKHLFPRGASLVAPVVSGIPIAVALSLAMKLPFVMDRGAPKSHGHGKRFEGTFRNSPDCLIVDDLITVGSTVAKSIAGLRAEGKRVSSVIVVVDREEGGRESLAGLGVTLYSLVTKKELIAALKPARRTP